MKEGIFYPYEPSKFSPRTYGFKGECSSGDGKEARWMKFYWTMRGTSFRAYCNQCRETILIENNKGLMKSLDRAKEKVKAKLTNKLK